jgi:protein tyrosine/serine phosphatase
VYLIERLNHSREPGKRQALPEPPHAAKRCAMTQDRILALEGVHNFRDYGGYAVAGGGRIKRGVLWRSAQHCDASADDLKQIAALEIGLVVDLRGTSEREANPCRRHAGFAGQVLTHNGETTGMGLHLEAAKGTPSPEQARSAMQGLYEGIATRANLRPMLGRYLKALVDTEGASLVHCVAGKDRTGFAVAMLHRLLGVHRDDVVADFMLTNIAGNIERRIAAGAEVIRARYGAISDETVRILMGVEPQWIEAALVSVEREHGTTERYAEAVLGVEPQDCWRLRERLIET